jgi:hypothetical protein
LTSFPIQPKRKDWKLESKSRRKRAKNCTQKLKSCKLNTENALTKVVTIEGNAPKLFPIIKKNAKKSLKTRMLTAQKSLRRRGINLQLNGKRCQKLPKSYIFPAKLTLGQ